MKLRDRLISAEKTLTDAMENIPVGLLIWNQEDRLVSFNKIMKDNFQKYGVDIYPGVEFLSTIKKYIENNGFVLEGELNKVNDIKGTEIIKTLTPIHNQLFLQESGFPPDIFIII